MSVIDARVRNIHDLPLEHFAQGDKFESRSVRIGPLVGAKDLGYSYDIVPPGKRSCPFHSHRAEEEMFFIVKGEGLLRYGSETRRIRAGDVICCPVGGPETAHRSSTIRRTISPICRSAPTCRPRSASTPTPGRSACSPRTCGT
jgi:uncharacterized cupin superfamily protein